MNNANAIILFTKSAQSYQDEQSESQTQLEAADRAALYAAVFEDVAEKISQLEHTDMFVYGGGATVANDASNKWTRHLQFRKAQEGTFSQQVHHAVTQAVAEQYLRIVVLIENHPVITVELLRNVFHQLSSDEDCVVIGPTYEGKYFLIGMKADHSSIFDPMGDDPISHPQLLLERLCECQIILLPTRSLYELDSIENLVRLRNELSLGQGVRPKNHKKTLSVLRMLDKKYKFNRVA